MKFKSLSFPYLVVFLFCILSTGTVSAQDAISLKQVVLHHDSVFWQAYNACDIAGMEIYLTDDVEFYHDKAGLTTSKKDFFKSVKAGLCGNANWRLRREPLPETIEVFALDHYGAILSGEHIFFILEKGKKERLDGLAKFTHVWRYQDNEWKMHRILSYDHGPAPYRNERKEISLSRQVLDQYAGEYRSAKAGIMTIAPEGNVLKLTAATFQVTLFPESENMFFVKERDLQFEFARDNNKVVKVRVHENGEVVEEAGRINP